MSKDYEIVVGLEVHAQLLTKSKLFCGDATGFGAPPNTQVSPISLAHPGTLPRLNSEAMHLAIRLGLATNCHIAREHYFARKHYFYPDLPKGYQVSQHTTPVCSGGFLDIAVGKETKRVRINRIHMEEDAGKSLHEEGSDFTNIDHNRAGMPLLEIVTEPDIRSAEEAFAFVSRLRQLVRHIGVCDGNMEEGSLRCDVNISVRPMSDTKLGMRVEIKNLNSVRFIKKAIEHEAQRLTNMHRRGEPILQQTRGLREEDFTTYPIRTKEDEDDYRYFPEPDLPPFFISEETIEKIRQELPPSPEQEATRLKQSYSLNDYDAGQLSGDPELTAYFEALAKAVGNNKAAANWSIGPVRNALVALETTASEFSISPALLAPLLSLVEQGEINHGTATQKIFPALLLDPELDIVQYIQKENLGQERSEDELSAFVDQALERHREKITEYKRGKKGLLSLFVGEVMKLSKGKADAKQVTALIEEKIKQY